MGQGDEPTLVDRTTRQARLYYLLDIPVMLGFVAILVSGFLISTWLSAPLGDAAAAWTELHVLASQVTLVLVVLKTALHWRWIAKATRRIVSWPTPQAADKAMTRPPMITASEIGRRDFVRLMSVVGVAAGLALFQTATQAKPSILQAVGAQSSSPGGRGNDAVSCTTRCPKGRSCTYPGHCRQYRDSNNNSRCDLGECT